MQRQDFKILIVDDERSMQLLIKRILSEVGYTVSTASDGKEALLRCEEFRPHLLLVDLKMPVMDGMSFIERYRQVDVSANFIVLTAYGSIDTAVRAMKMGAIDYITKPLEGPEALRDLIEAAFEQWQIKIQRQVLKTSLFKELPPVEVMFGGMEEVLEEVSAVASTKATVLITGETGTGKTQLARHIHNISEREGAFVEINCATMTENLIESELFGHEKGAFTGAVAQKKGKFEQATGGTIFLDEVTEMNDLMQAKFLRVIESGVFERLGSVVTQRTDARIVCATNKDLQTEVAQGRFRQDLFFRLNVFPIQIPPLRMRKGHIARIAQYLIEQISLALGKEVKQLSAGSREMLISYPWPGNVRELQNVLERSIILSRIDTIDITKSRLINQPQKVPAGRLLDMEKKAIEDALILYGGNRKQAAEALGISLRTMHYKIKEFGLK
ncbi:MAG: sigma-54-dependent Fis family transcriptional regulator [Nitrospirae bacterium]|nr:sigma-54-dependent Fis family transcriptional regulator [Nitrospirota bacterium]